MILSVISVIVPTRNEAANILPLLLRLDEALQAVAIEVIFVDDSTDGTPQAIQRVAAGFDFPIRLIARPPKRRNGLSGAVVEGMAAAEAEWICVMDADLQHPPEMVALLLEQAKHTRADIIVGSRKADAFGPLGLNRRRSITSQLLTILARMVFPRLLKNVSDPLTGLFLVRRTAVDLTLLQPDGFKILLEILIRHPEFRVSEIHFDFAPRHGGQSKADMQEGLRFFRHLMRLRLTANPHFRRFLLVVGSAVAGNLALLAGLVKLVNWPVMAAAWLAAEAAAVYYFYLAETWVFRDDRERISRRRWIAFLLISQLFLFAIYLPLLSWFQAGLAMNYLAAALVASLAVGFIFYLLSEQWVWTRGLTMRRPAQYTYDLHGLVRIISQVALPDLAYFQVESAAARYDLQIRVDRHGTPSRLPGAICYDEQLGRFGFGLTVLPGEFTEIIVSPLLETSPGFLYTNVVEPIVRWLLVQRGNALVRAAGVARPGHSPGRPSEALLIHGSLGMGYALGRLCATAGFTFAGDDVVIVGRRRRLLPFPKPVTVDRQIVREWPADGLDRQENTALRFQRLLYSRPVRRFALWVSAHDLPVATLNTYLQRFIPQSKELINQLNPGIRYAQPSSPTYVVVLERGEGRVGVEEMTLEETLSILLEPRRGAFTFQPGPLLDEEMSRWNGRDWRQEEEEIVRAALAGCQLLRWRSAAERWWEQLPEVIGDQLPEDERNLVRETSEQREEVINCHLSIDNC
jgi:glycosyltransferase involved in cell wall biosynthesis